MEFALSHREVEFVREVVHCIATANRTRLKDITDSRIAETDVFWGYVSSFNEQILDLPEDISNLVRHLVMENGDISVDIFMRTEARLKSDIILVFEKDAKSGALSVEYIYRS